MVAHAVSYQQFDDDVCWYGWQRTVTVGKEGDARTITMWIAYTIANSILTSPLKLVRLIFCGCLDGPAIYLKTASHAHTSPAIRHLRFPAMMPEQPLSLHPFICWWYFHKNILLSLSLSREFLHFCCLLFEPSACLNCTDLWLFCQLLVECMVSFFATTTYVE